MPSFRSGSHWKLHHQQGRLRPGDPPSCVTSHDQALIDIRHLHGVASRETYATSPSVERHFAYRSICAQVKTWLATYELSDLCTGQDVFSWHCGITLPQILFFLECTECLRLPHSSNQTVADPLTLSSSGWFWQWMHGSINSLTPNFTTALYSAQSAPLGPSLPALGNGLGARAVL